MTGRFFISIVAGLVLSSTANSNAATVVFSSLSPFNTYQYSGYSISGSNSAAGYFQVANRFVPTSGGILSSIELGLSYVNTPNQVDVSLRLDGPSQNFPSSSVLFSETVTTTFAEGTSNSELLSVVPLSSILLTSGMGYWIVVQPHTPDSANDWAFATAAGNAAYSYGPSQPWTSLSGNSLNAFRVSVVPEPTALSMVSLGLAGFASRRLAKKK